MATRSRVRSYESVEKALRLAEISVRITADMDRKAYQKQIMPFMERLREYGIYASFRPVETATPEVKMMSKGLYYFNSEFPSPEVYNSGKFMDMFVHFPNQVLSALEIKPKFNSTIYQLLEQQKVVPANGTYDEGRRVGHLLAHDPYYAPKLVHFGVEALQLRDAFGVSVAAVIADCSPPDISRDMFRTHPVVGTFRSNDGTSVLSIMFSKAAEGQREELKTIYPDLMSRRTIADLKIEDLLRLEEALKPIASEDKDLSTGIRFSIMDALRSHKKDLAA